MQLAIHKPKLRVARAGPSSTFNYFVLDIFLCSGHDDEVLDVSFDYTGQMIVTGSADGSGRVYNAVTHQCICKLEGHEGEISKVGV